MGVHHLSRLGSLVFLWLATACSTSGSSGDSSGSGGSGGSGGKVSEDASTSSGGSSGRGGALGAGGASGFGGALASGGATGGGDIVGKITVGFQGWFDAPNDGSGITPGWWHWTPDRNTPTATNIGIKSWPDMKDYTKTYPSGFANLGSGAAATLYSDWDASTIETQVTWMEDVGIDTIALQRFGDFRGTNEQRNVVAAHIRDAAEAHGRKFYIMYDITGWDTFDTDLPSDWTTHIIGELGLTSSSAYAMQDGKAVVCIWGIGYRDHPGTPENTLALVNWFKTQGLYVIGGVGNDWRVADGQHWAQSGFGAVFDALDAVSPWMVGVIGDDAGSDWNRTNYNEGDVASLHARGKHYQPCVLPGDLQLGQRKHGDFMWHQFFNMIQIGSDGLYVSMFDEYNEGNQIGKTAATQADVPAGSAFKTLDEDGTGCSADYYLRLTGDGGRMLKAQTALTATRPTPTQ